MKMIAFTEGENIPSRRFRLAQHIDNLRKYKIDVDEKYSQYTSYPPKDNRIIWGIKNLCTISQYPIKSKEYDVTFLQRTFISKFATFERLTKGPRIFDVDDAIFLRSNHTDKIAKDCEGIICGNKFLADYYSRFNKNVYIIPTAVDTSRFFPRKIGGKDKFIIGWSGTSSNLKYLYEIEQQLERAVSYNDDIVLRIISNEPPQFKAIPNEKIQFIRWSLNNEVSALQEMDIGIMPLIDSEWEKGKCSYKMLTYMACGIPVAVSEVGMNKQVLKLGECGIGIKDNSKWEEELIRLYKQKEYLKYMGREGQKIINRKFSISIVSKQIAEVIWNIKK